MASQLSAILDCRLVRIPDAESTVSATGCYEVAGRRKCNGPYAVESWSASEYQYYSRDSLVRSSGRRIIIGLSLESREQGGETVFGNAVARWIGSHSGVLVIFGGRRWAARRLIAILHSSHGNSSRDLPVD